MIHRIGIIGGISYCIGFIRKALLKFDFLDECFNVDQDERDKSVYEVYVFFGPNVSQENQDKFLSFVSGWIAHQSYEIES